MHSDEKSTEMDPYIIVVTYLLLLFPHLSLPLLMSKGNSVDRSALFAFKKRIVNDPQNALGSWNEMTHVCEWRGVVCSPQQRVTQLNLNRTELEGTISPFLSNLSFLQWLDLSENSLHGPIPEEFGALSNLRVLSLRGNGVQQQVPHSLSKLAQLIYIDLSSNRLHGRLSMPLFSNCTELIYVDLSNNEFTGLIPPDIGNQLPYLEHLLLYFNQLTDKMPASLCNATNLLELDLENNFLSGILPSEIFACMHSLEILHLSYNGFHSYEGNSNLNPFFNAMSNLTHLQELELAGSNLGGTLPASIGLLGVNLTELDLQGNKIHGVIPPNISNLSNLSSLNLSNNYLSGTIPLKLILLPKLERLWLSNNSLQGQIPSPPYELKNLGLIDLSQNKLSGTIPATLASLSRLTMLFLGGNLLSGSIPSSLGNLKLQFLDLSHNRLTGTLPPEVAGIITISRYFNLSHNSLDGSIPMSLGKMKLALVIDLSSNHFTGIIPPSLGGCEEVQLVSLSNNHLEGPIPGTLGSLLSLQSLDLSSNLLSGVVPSSLLKCTELKQIDLSFNNFSGQLPQGGIFAALPLESITGNHFCGSLPILPSCYANKRSVIHSWAFLSLLACIASLLAFLATVLCVIGYRKLRRRLVFQLSDTEFTATVLNLSSSYPRITYRELVDVTSGFEPSRLIGTGSYGHVYRGVLSDGTVVAIKVLQFTASNSTRSFNRECQVLKTIRHRNLMRIITTCSLPDFKALVLPYMANGSLESHLYPQSQQPGSSQLRLVKRVNICSDIAEGMAYLHHYSPVQVIHCDLKPSNILLNDDMTALVSDFGISRLVTRVTERNMIAENMTNSTGNVLCGSVGYIAPEYGYGRSASIKGDVYSFGIVVLELVTGKRPTDEMFSEGQSLQRWVKNHYHDRPQNVIDSFLLHELGEQNPEIRNMWEVGLMELLDLGLVCTQEAPTTRPTMLDAAYDLDRLKRYLGGDTTATFSSLHGISSSTITRGDDW